MYLNHVAFTENCKSLQIANCKLSSFVVCAPEGFKKVVFRSVVINFAPGWLLRWKMFIYSNLSLHYKLLQCKIKRV